LLIPPPPGRAPAPGVTLASAAGAGRADAPGCVVAELLLRLGLFALGREEPWKEGAVTVVCLAPEDATSASRGTGAWLALVTKPGSLNAATAAPANATATTMIVRVLLTLFPADADAL
jgi:hypothetical protein